MRDRNLKGNGRDGDAAGAAAAVRVTAVATTRDHNPSRARRRPATRAGGTRVGPCPCSNRASDRVAAPARRQRPRRPKSPRWPRQTGSPAPAFPARRPSRPVGRLGLRPPLLACDILLAASLSDSTAVTGIDRRWASGCQCQRLGRAGDPSPGRKLAFPGRRVYKHDSDVSDGLSTGSAGPGAGSRPWVVFAGKPRVQRRRRAMRLGRRGRASGVRVCTSDSH
jgi:hypothetical protein